MGSLLYIRQSKDSIVGAKDDTVSSTIVSLIQKFSQVFCELRGLPSESPLYTLTTVGAHALPLIQKMMSILKGKSGLEWSRDGELPVEIPLQGMNDIHIIMVDVHRYHSVFICPVSKERATETNPAMLIACGHVVVKESLGRLSKGKLLTSFYNSKVGWEDLSVHIAQLKVQVLKQFRSTFKETYR